MLKDINITKVFHMLTMFSRNLNGITMPNYHKDFKGLNAILNGKMLDRKIVNKVSRKKWCVIISNSRELYQLLKCNAALSKYRELESTIKKWETVYIGKSTDNQFGLLVNTPVHLLYNQHTKKQSYYNTFLEHLVIAHDKVMGESGLFL